MTTNTAMQTSGDRPEALKKCCTTQPKPIAAVMPQTVVQHSDGKADRRALSASWEMPRASGLSVATPGIEAAINQHGLRECTVNS